MMTKTMKKSPADALEDLQSEMLLREAQEALRREQMEKLWKAYAPVIIAGAALILIVIGGHQLWRSRAIRLAQEAGDGYAAAVQQLSEGRVEDAQKAFGTIIKDGPEGYATLARMQAAAAAIKAGKTEDAVRQLDALADDGSADQLLRDAARLKAAALRVDSADWTEIRNRLTPLTETASHWRLVAREMLGLAAFKAGKLADARQSIQEILSDPKAPPSLSQRAQVVMAQIVAAELREKFQGPAKAPGQGAPTVLAPGTTQGGAGPAGPAATGAPASGEPQKKKP